jgi:hypothetical protein
MMPVHSADENRGHRYDIVCASGSEAADDRIALFQCEERTDELRTVRFDWA